MSELVTPRVSEPERLRRWRMLLGPAVDDVWLEADPPAPRPADGDGDGGTGDGATGADGTGDGEDGGDRGVVGTGTDAGADAGPEAGRDGGSAGGDRGRTGRQGLRGDDARIDAALGAIYDRDDRGRFARGGSRAGGLGRSKPGVVRWLGDIRRYFPTPVVQILQRDAVERLDLRQLLLEPELLASVEPDIHLVTLLVELNRHLPDETRATARAVIAQVLADLERRLTDTTRQAVRGALARAARTRRPRPGDIDWPSTISANLRHWLPEHRTVVPERLIGHGRRQHSLARDVIIAVDQSGSMADSVVYASLFGGVLAQLPALRTSFVAFDTAVTDLTPFLHDPVEVLFGVQLGGGTDIAHALRYCRGLVERPRETVLFLVSDLFEGGRGEELHALVAELVGSGVRVVVLLALSDEGAPSYDHEHAAALGALGASVLATTPAQFPDVLADALGT
jgi:Mg-chelatase subunit ChlD